VLYILGLWAPDIPLENNYSTGSVYIAINQLKYRLRLCTTGNIACGRGQEANIANLSSTLTNIQNISQCLIQVIAMRKLYNIENDAHVRLKCVIVYAKHSMQTCQSLITASCVANLWAYT